MGRKALALSGWSPASSATRSSSLASSAALASLVPRGCVLRLELVMRLKAECHRRAGDEAGARRRAGTSSSASSSRQQSPPGSRNSSPPMSRSLRVTTPTIVGQLSTTSRWRKPSERKSADTRRSDEFCAVTTAASLMYGRKSIRRSSSSADMRTESAETASLNHGRRKSSAARACGSGPGEGARQLCALSLARMVTSCSRSTMPSTRGLRWKGVPWLPSAGRARWSCEEAMTGKPWCVVVLRRSMILPTRSTSHTDLMEVAITCLACSRSRSCGGSSGSIG
mmetsp:Transcript_47556/g.157626  ORF Transcript_47556/g.157626 Transcript_47556/m.157626 type:complete len:282 (+) Transcript_47556:226-1071(+)